MCLRTCSLISYSYSASGQMVYLHVYAKEKLSMRFVEHVTAIACPKDIVLQNILRIFPIPLNFQVRSAPMGLSF